MSRSSFAVVATLLTATLGLGSPLAARVAQQAAAPTFTSGVDLVRVSAVVRDRKGHFVEDLAQRDFTILDDGNQRMIADFRHDLAGVSIALLFDVSGSMEAGLGNAREAAGFVSGKYRWNPQPDAEQMCGNAEKRADILRRRGVH